LTLTTPILQPAIHAAAADFWRGAGYGLNLTFAPLDDMGWEQVLSTLWHDTRLFGPLASRPNVGSETPALVTQRYPASSDMLTQHALFTINEFTVGCDVQISRTLFESVSVQIPLSMFNGFDRSDPRAEDHPELAAIDAIYYEMALAIYAVRPFQIAAIGVERGPVTLFELSSNPQARHDLLVHGNFLADEDFLSAIEPDLRDYEPIRPGLRFKPRQKIG